MPAVRHRLQLRQRAEVAEEAARLLRRAEASDGLRTHGFAAPELGIRADVKPHETVKVRVTPDKVGTFAFHCDLFCGDGHEGMSGTIVVAP